MSEPWLSVVGIGEDGLDGVSAAARAVVGAAQVVVGGRRHLDMLGPTDARPLAWPSPFAEGRALLNSLRGKNVVVLASGDPMYFGVGATLSQWFPDDDIAVLPHPGAFSLAAAALRWPLQECLCLSVHGRPLATLALHLAPERRLLILAEDGSSPAAIATLLTEAGFGPSDLCVLAHLGGPAQSLRSGTAETWAGTSPALAVVAVHCRAARSRAPLALVPGLPDDAFSHDGQLTKREIRAATLAALAPLPGQMLWDVGAGCGSVAIEWMRAGGRAVAIESHAGRVAMIGRNAARLGVPGLDIIHGLAPDALPYTDPDAVFVGGGVSAPGVLSAAWAALRGGGRLVANAVTAEGEAALLAFHAAQGGQLIRLALSRLEPVGRFHTWRPALPVTQYMGTKP